jgi:LysM repeat protein
MKKLALLLFIIPVISFAAPKDSIGTKTEEGVVYVLHKVEKGETLFGIARKYGANPNEVFKANPGSEKTIKIDEVLRIPTNRKPSNGNVEKNINTKPDINRPTGASVDQTLYHTVVAGEGLFRIASKYNVTVQEIKDWNGLESDVISVGQKLMVSEPRAYIAIEQNNKSNETKSPDNNRKNEVKTEVTAKRTDPTNQSNIATETVTNVAVVNEKVEGNPADEESVSLPSRKVRTIGDEIIETGTVSISTEGELSQERNFVVHPTAKIGTIVMITNTENGKSAFARVIGNYRATAEEVARINPTLSKKLGINESTRSVKINYAK